MKIKIAAKAPRTWMTTPMLGMNIASTSVIANHTDDTVYLLTLSLATICSFVILQTTIHRHSNAALKIKNKILMYRYVHVKILICTKFIFFCSNCIVCWGCGRLKLNMNIQCWLWSHCQYIKYNLKLENWSFCLNIQRMAPCTKSLPLEVFYLYL